MITVQDAVREFGGRWQSPKGMLVVHDDNSYEFCDVRKSGTIICTRYGFNVEAKRLGYEVPGYQRIAPGDFSFLPPIGKECEFAYEGEKFFKCIPRYHGKTCSVIDDSGTEVWISREGGRFRPLKSDRERWVEAARDEGFPLWVAGLMYDKIKSCELPIPEAK